MDEILNLIESVSEGFPSYFFLIILSKPTHIVSLTGLFCSVVASGTSHFYSFFSVNGIFGMTTMAFAWQAKPRPKIGPQTKTS